MFTIGVVGAALYGGLTVGTAFVIGQVVGRVVVPALDRGSVGPAALGVGFTVIMAVAVLRIVALATRRLGAAATQFRLTAEYRRRIVRRYLALPLSWHRRHATGTLLSNASSDVEALWAVFAAVPLAVGTLFMLVVAVGGLFLVDWAFGLVAVALFPVLFGLNAAFSRRMAPRVARAQALRAQVSAVAHESFDGALVVKTMGREAAETDRFAARTRQLRDAMVEVGRVRGVFDPLIEALPNIGSLLVLVMGLIRVRQGAATVEEIFSVSFLFSMLAVPIRSIGWTLTEIPRSVAGWDRVRAVLAATGDMPYGRRTLATPAGTPVPLAFHDVRYAYDPPPDAPASPARDALASPTRDALASPAPGALASPDPDAPVAAGLDAVNGVSFEVPAGRTVALVGPTGSGKSTIAALAARLIDPASGTVTIDGVDVRTLSAAELARTVALVPQIPFVFDDTVRGNVALDRAGIDDDQVWRALQLAQADGFVKRLPAGLSTPLGERGTSLSGGQRQRLTLARALAGSPRLLVLDDATSAVDPRVEAAILRGLRRASVSTQDTEATIQAPTILVVAYRRATIALADEVVFLDGGRVVARGPHEELLATVPAYADLVTAYERADAEREQALATDDDQPPGLGTEPPDEDPARVDESARVHEIVDDVGRAKAVS
ncbi:MAG: ABC transporter ATP-binding protein [Micromonosporaceae bacterium]|nr:ABC transporter ATP-binding protein [Micromonosporaceae bacterium]